jgi:hypothetical protein
VRGLFVGSSSQGSGARVKGQVARGRQQGTSTERIFMKIEKVFLTLSGDYVYVELKNRGINRISFTALQVYKNSRDLSHIVGRKLNTTNDSYRFENAPLMANSELESIDKADMKSLLETEGIAKMLSN